MDWLQGPMINPSCQFLDHQCLEEEEEQQQHTRFEEELDETMPFLHMLQSFETPSFFPFKEPSFQALLRLQHLKKKNHNNNTCEFETTNIYNNNYLSHEIMETQIQALEFEPFGNNDTANTYHDSPVKSELLKAHHNKHLEQEEEQELETQNAKTGLGPKDKRKRKRTRPTKNKEEVESQRMTHITVERNRRRQMNEHLTVLRSLMPKTYIQRGDQASIVGGAIDFVKELEQLAQSLEGQKRMRISTLEFESTTNSSLSSSSSSSNSSSTISSCSSLSNNNNNNNGLLLRSERKTELADIEATVIQTHVNLKIQCPKRPSQLLKAIVALEDLRLAILHLNINTSSHDTVLYSFNLKIEDGCNLRSADEICGAVHQIFRNIDGR